MTPSECGRAGKVKEQNRLRKQKQREKQKKLSVSHDGHTMSRDSHAADIDIEPDTETEKERKEVTEEKSPAEKADAKKNKAGFCSTHGRGSAGILPSKKNGVDPVRSWEYFDTGGWKDSEGKPVRNWKQKMITWENHSKEKGNDLYDSGRISSDSVSEWDHCYTFDGRTL